MSGPILTRPSNGGNSTALGLGPLIDGLSDAQVMWATTTAAAALCACMGAALGVALPTGMRHFTKGKVAVAEAWAINCGFSVAGPALGAVTSILLGSRGLAALALPCYAVARLMMHRRQRATRSKRRQGFLRLAATTS
jgi:hypothetical protein